MCEQSSLPYCPLVWMCSVFHTSHIFCCQIPPRPSMVDFIAGLSACQSVVADLLSRCCHLCLRSLIHPVPSFPHSFSFVSNQKQVEQIPYCTQLQISNFIFCGPVYMSSFILLQRVCSVWPRALFVYTARTQWLDYSGQRNARALICFTPSTDILRREWVKTKLSD